MKAALVFRRSLTWAAAIASVLALVALGLAALVGAGYGKALLVRGVALATGREIHVNGSLRVHLFSRSPEVIAEQVTIGNPPWMPPGRTAEVDRLSMVLALPWFGRPAGLVRFDMEGAALHLVREADLRANWQMADPAHQRIHKNSPILRSLDVPDAHVELADARRHLQFTGTVSVSGPDDPRSPQPVRLVGSGQLNGRAVTFRITGDPLTTASHHVPYRFTFSEQSSGSHIQGNGALPEPFNFKIENADFEATGPDLKDLYYLTGIHLLDTGAYHLTGRILRRGLRTTFSDLAVTSGQSDMRGSVSVDSSTSPRRFVLDLSSRNLKLADLGARAAGRAPGPKPPQLLSDARISLNVLRIGDATVKYSAGQVQIGRVPLRHVAARASLDGGVLSVAPATAQVLGGHATGQLRLDGRKDVPTAALDLDITDLQLAQIPFKDSAHPPIEGPLRMRVVVNGTGRSVHEIASSASGTVTAQLRSGEIRESFAELTGLDLRGLRLLLFKSRKETPVRCAVARFKAHDGTLTVQDLVADTDPMLITGEGQVDLGSEALALEIHGDPKHLRFFRLRAPLLLAGTLAHPSIHVLKDDSKLKVIDRGKAPDADCAALLEDSRTAADLPSRP